MLHNNNLPRAFVGGRGEVGTCAEAEPRRRREQREAPAREGKGRLGLVPPGRQESRGQETQEDHCQEGEEGGSRSGRLVEEGEDGEEVAREEAGGREEGSRCGQPEEAQDRQAEEGEGGEAQEGEDREAEEGEGAEGREAQVAQEGQSSKGA